MLDGREVATKLKEAGVTHVVWIPDSDLGTWDAALSATDGINLIRVCREGEAFAVAAGLWIGGKRPIVLIQCTGLFEAGDALRNVIHEMKAPLFFVVGVRSWRAHQKGQSTDTCPVFTEPIMDAWKVPYTLLPENATTDDLIGQYQRFLQEGQARAVLLPE